MALERPRTQLQSAFGRSFDRSLSVFTALWKSKIPGSAQWLCICRPIKEAAFAVVVAVVVAVFIDVAVVAAAAAAAAAVVVAALNHPQQLRHLMSPHAHARMLASPAMCDVQSRDHVRS